MDTGILSLIIACGTALCGLVLYGRILRLRVEAEREAARDAEHRVLEETRQLHADLGELREQVAELRRLLVEAG